MEKNIHILVVEDDEIDREAVARFTAKENLPYRLTYAESDTEAINALEKETFDIIILDYDLRTATGLDILPHTGGIPVLFVTGSGNEEIAVEAMRRGAADYLVKDPERNYLKVLPLTIRNVLERKKAAIALQNSEEKLRLFMNAATEAFLVWDQDLNLIEINEAAVALVPQGLNTKGWIGKHILDIDPSTEETGRYQKYREVVETGVPVEFTDVTPNPQYGDVCWVIKAFKVGDGMGMIITDTTERKKSEEERLRLESHVQQVQKFESLNVMAGSIAHSFNNLLMGVLGNLELARANLRDNPEAADANLSKAGNAAERVADLSKMMLTYVGQSKGDVRAVDITEVVRNMSEILDASVSKRVMLQLELSDEPGFFEGDPFQIRQVIMNLVTNAVEAIGTTEGVITVTTGFTSCRHGDFQQPFLQEDFVDGDYVYVEVSDTGSGMDEETLSKAFDPFFTTRFKGRGMGLPAVLGIVRSYRGAVSLKSDIGRGTTARLLFPNADAPEEILPKPGEDIGDWRGSGTILLVDDEEMVLEVGMDMLEELGFRVLTAADGVEAVDLFREKHDQITCVILDMTMPRMDGEEAYRRMRVINADTPVVICSGYTEEQLRRRFVDTLPAPFIGKPFQLTDLAAVLKKTLPPRHQDTKGATGAGV